MPSDLNYKKDFPSHIEQVNPAMDDLINNTPYIAKLIVAISKGNIDLSSIHNFIGVSPHDLIGIAKRKGLIIEGDGGYGVILDKCDAFYLRNNLSKIDAQILHLTR